MEYFFDEDKPHWTAWCQVQKVDAKWEFFEPDERENDATPLYYASLGGFYDLAEHLVGKHPEQVNGRSGQMVTPLVAALCGKHFQVAELLHRHGADVDVCDYMGDTPLCEACRCGVRCLDIAQWLLNHGADVNSLDYRHRASLYHAVVNGHLQVVQMLIEHNADIHIRASGGVSPLHEANGNIDIMQVLLGHGANANARDNRNSTPLHGSSNWRTAEGTRLLLEHGAIIDAEDDEGRTPLQLALDRGRHDIATCLKEHGATR
jgi:ankyrin repeat protein